MSNNPFVVGKPVTPEFFVGRKYEIAVSFAQIFQHGHLAIWGGPGMGRSSFLELLASPAVCEEHGLDPSEAVIALLSCENINPFTPSSFWREVLSVMKDNLESETALQAEIEKLLEQGKTTKDNLNKILQKLGKKHRFLVLLVNDFDIALQENEKYTEANMQQFLSECRSLAVASTGGKYLSMVVTSLKRLSELGPKLNPNASPWYNHYLFQHIKLLNDREIEQLLGVMPMTLGLREAIKEIAGGHPTLLQIAGFLLYAQLETDRKANRVSDIQEFIKKFETETRHIFQTTWNRCSEIEQTLLMLLALFNLKGRLHKNKNFDLGNIDLIFTQRGRELTNLEEQGVIICKQEEEKIVYSFTSLMMQKWVIQEVWNTNNALIQERQKVFLKLISHKQLNQIESLWKQKDGILSTIEWFGKLVAAFPKGFI
ncbi:MAG: ATP-binding protein [Nostoc sp.]|uniref:ATP-binding protein n=1 Tax=Nostoc sp. TaxID=1180 RepID=UPI002FF5B332